MRKLKSVLPWIALASAVVAAGLLVAGSFYRKARIVDTGETRAVVEKALNELLAIRPDSLEDQVFKAAFMMLSASRFVVQAFLVEKDGTIIHADESTPATRGSGALSGESPVTETTSESKGTVTMAGTLVLGFVTSIKGEGLPHDEFSSDQLLLLSVSAALEGRDADHDDVFATLVRTVRNEAGEPLGAIGVRYDRSPWISAIPEAAWIALVLGFALFLAIYWISVPAWTFLDARERGERAWVWAAFTLVGNMIALVAYLLAREPRSAKGA